MTLSRVPDASEELTFVLPAVDDGTASFIEPFA